MMEFGGKSSFNLGLDSKIVTNGNNFFLDLARVLSRSLLGMVEALRN